MANERTFLAWIRTSLALIAGGVALEALGLDLQVQLRLAAAGVLVLAGMVVPLIAWREWMQTERALRLDEPLPAARTGLVMAAAIALAGLLVAVALLLR
ncbi:YidH family protein [Agreia sp.]|uniref:YidH family protein n=1 Tax=Agreia sp. TaxID=1872416 RepID=UPI0035BC611F